MIRLKSLDCTDTNACGGKQCDRAFIGGAFYEVHACEKCDFLMCGHCMGEHETCGTCDKIMTHYPLLSQLCDFVNTAPADELGLIDLQTCSSSNCDGCNLESEEYFRSGLQIVRCDKCCTNKQIVWSTSSNLEARFHRIIRELIESYMPRTRTRRAGVNGVLPVKILLNCATCAVPLESSHRPLIGDGKPTCRACFSNNPPNEFCDSLWKFMALIECIPENQLGLLSYSKWVNAVECQDHLQLLNSLTAISASAGSTEKPLRSFFKNDGLNQSETSDEVILEGADELASMNCSETTSCEAKRVATFLSTMKPTTDQFVPANIVCSCGRREELSNMFDCFTCPSYGVCSLCVTRKHWGHEIKDTKKAVVACLINEQSEKTLNKLTEWIRLSNESRKKGERTFWKICQAISEALTMAAEHGEDIGLVEELLAKTDVTDIDRYFKIIITNNMKAYKLMERFSDRLTETVKNCGRTLQEAEEMSVSNECAKFSDPNKELERSE